VDYKERIVSYQYDLYEALPEIIQHLKCVHYTKFRISKAEMLSQSLRNSLLGFVEAITNHPKTLN